MRIVTDGGDKRREQVDRVVPGEAGPPRHGPLPRRPPHLHPRAQVLPRQAQRPLLPRRPLVRVSQPRQFEVG